MKDYKAIWDNLSESFLDASYHVCCVGDEDEIRSNGQITAAFLKEVLQIEPDDIVLEIGCGVARIGRELAPSCGEWHGADIAGNMIKYAAMRTQGLQNVFLYELPSNDLSIFPDDTFDCVYCTIVFMHLDKYDMFNYIREAQRVLVPGGRAYFDTYNILAPGAWQEFIKVLDSHPSGQRPGHVSQFSTPQEVGKFMEEAGFADVHIDGENNSQLVVALGRKPQRPGFERRKLPVRPSSAPAAGEVENDLLGQEISSRLHLDTMLASLRADVDRLNGIIHIKNRRMEELEQAVILKNDHITAMEDLVARLERQVNRQSRALSSPVVRIILRLLRAARVLPK